MQNDLVASFVFGAGLILLGACLARWHLRAWQAHRNDGTLNDGERAHYRAQVRRRVHISFLLILLGVIIPAWDVLATRRFLSTQAALLGIIVMLLVALWIMVLAMLDWLSTRVRRRAMLGALTSLARKKRELEDEVIRLRQQQRNGHS